MKLSTDNKFKGVYFDKQSNKWEANRMIDGKRIKKRFKSKSDAIAYRLELENKHAL